MSASIDIWKFQRTLSRRLLLWAAGSILLGLVLILTSGAFWQGFGIQALAWGAIDGLIAGFGARFSRRRRNRLADPADPQLLEGESRKLRRTLFVNTALDVLYIAGGITLSATMGAEDPAWHGHGWGIIIQGAFLFFFDLIHGQSVPPGTLSAPLGVFADPVHQPFFLQGGDAAALLVHGFPGTPAEMRPLGEALNGQGWTVQGILLPGFGARFSEILEHGYGDWLDAVMRAHESLRRKYKTVLLVGYSLGGALVLSAAARRSPDGLVLLSPFWRLGTRFQRIVGRVLRPILPRYFRPLRKADLSDAGLLESLGEFFPNIDLNDPQTQTWLRELQVPISVIRQILHTGRRGYRSAGSIDLPVLVVQGSDDELVRADNTRKLVLRMKKARRNGKVPKGSRTATVRPRRHIRYLEISGGHNIIEEQATDWPKVLEALSGFSHSLLRVAKTQN